MYIHGEFVSRLGEVIGVYIVTGGDRTKVVEIAPDSEIIQFPADSPVDIASEVNDTFDVLLPQSATIRLLTRSFIPDLFGAAVTDAVVNIYKGGACVFAGFVEPQSYSQPYNETWDELEINCIDVLSALQYRKVNGGDWANAWQKLEGVTFQGLLFESLAPFVGAVNLLPEKGGGVSVWYDGSKGINKADTPEQRSRTLSTLRVSPAVFLGEDEEDMATSQKVVEDVLKYLNLHIRQEGLNFYVFDWATVKKGGSVLWTALPLSFGVTAGIGAAGTSPTQKATRCEVIEITADIVEDTDTSISIGEVYNKIVLTDNVTEVSELIEDPLNEADLTAAHPRQLYLTEYHSNEGNASGVFDAFHKGVTKSDNVTITEYYVQAMTHKNWVFSNGAEGLPDTDTPATPKDPNASEVKDWMLDLAKLFAELGSSLQGGAVGGWLSVPNMLARNMAAAILSVGKVERKADVKDNSLVARLDSSPVLVVGVNGNGYDTDLMAARPSTEELKTAIPVARYTGRVGAVLSPADTSTTNYIVIGGKITLNARNYEGKGGAAMRKYAHSISGVLATEPAAYKGGILDGASPIGSFSRYLGGFSPYTGKGDKLFEFKYSAIGDNTDTISKVAALSCMLIVGNKCVVESGTQGQISDFSWKTYKPLAECANEEEYYAQSFTIGFNPKIGDYLIGQEYDIQNNIHYSMNIDAEGMAIPIREADNVSGEVRFIILGAVNSVFDDITRRHPTFFRHTKWGATSRLILPHVANIQIKDFGIKIVSDSGGLNTDNGKDIVYCSDVSNKFDNPKDDIEFDITTALTHEECKRMGILNKVNLSSPVNAINGGLIRAIYDMHTDEEAKPEQLYVDAYYREYSRPRVVMEQTLRDRGGVVGIFNHYIHPAIGKTFFVQGISRNLIEGTARLTIKEIGT